MNKYILLAALAIGCGDSLNEHLTEEQRDASPTDAETGSLSEPIVIHGDYGFTSSYGVCAHPFPGGKCYGADSKSNTFVWHAYSCNWLVSGESGAWWYQRIEQGLKRGVEYLNARGWPSNIVKLTAAPQTNQYLGNVHVRCDSSTTGSPGQTFIQEGFLDSFDCHDTSAGDFCQYDSGRLEIRPGRFPANPQWATATHTQRAYLVNNTMFHEVMHYGGLPHRTQASSTDTNVMNPAIHGWLSPMWTTKMVPDVNQSLALYCYVPSSSTVSMVGCPDD